MTDNSASEAALSESRFQEIAHEIGRTAEGRAFLSTMELRSRVVAADEVRALVGGLRELWEQRGADAQDIVRALLGGG